METFRGLSIEETLELHDLHARYFWATDTGDVDTYVDCFAGDGRFVMNALQIDVRGHDGIREMAEGIRDTSSLTTRHWANNVQFWREGNIVKSRCYVIWLDTNPGDSGIKATAIYDDTFVRNESTGRFCIQERRISLDT